MQCCDIMLLLNVGNLRWQAIHLKFIELAVDDTSHLIFVATNLYLLNAVDNNHG